MDMIDFRELEEVMNEYDLGIKVHFKDDGTGILIKYKKYKK